MTRSESSPSETERLAQHLEQAWLRVQGVQPLPIAAIHPDDDMYKLDVLGPFPLERRLRYMRSGYEALLVLEHALRCFGRELSNERRVLDFACGYGRVLRFLRTRLAPERLQASDILEPANRFVAQQFGVSSLSSATDSSALKLGSPYSLIWVGSLFSHLPTGAFSSFLERLYGALDDDGLLVLSTHAAEVRSGSAAKPPGFLFEAHSESALLPSHEYGTSYVAEQSFRELCSVLGIHAWRRLPFELWGVQDVYLLSKRPLALQGVWTHAPIVRGFVVEKRLSAEGHAWIGGYVRTPKSCGELQGIDLLLDEHTRISVQFRAHPKELEPALGGAVQRQFDWYTEGSIAHLPRGFHSLVLEARFHSGPRSCFAGCELIW